jgi:hypothetical protein
VTRPAGIVYILICSAIVVWGCSPARRPLLERNVSMSSIIERVTERNSRIRTMRGDGTVTIESPEASMTGTLDVRIRKPDSVRIDFGGPFGIHVGTLALSREHFIYYDWRENLVTKGSPDKETLRDVLHFPLAFDDILNACTGEFPFPPVSDTAVADLSVEGESYVLRYRGDGWTREYHIDGDADIVTGYRLLDSSRKAVLIAAASDIDSDGPIAMPRLLRIIIPADHRSLTVSYSGTDFNIPVTCSFAVPRRSESPGQ